MNRRVRYHTQLTLAIAAQKVKNWMEHGWYCFSDRASLQVLLGSV